jgi:hypothetical protein
MMPVVPTGGIFGAGLLRPPWHSGWPAAAAGSVTGRHWQVLAVVGPSRPLAPSASELRVSGGLAASHGGRWDPVQVSSWILFKFQVGRPGPGCARPAARHGVNFSTVKEHL